MAQIVYVVQTYNKPTNTWLLDGCYRDYNTAVSSCCGYVLSALGFENFSENMNTLLENKSIEGFVDISTQFLY